tara:strand:+ start:42903 stop:43517 length:615 start_codon:yes stop_codon:yes gene_type:complete
MKFKGVDEVMNFIKVATDRNGRPVYEMKGRVGQHIAIPAGKHLQDYNWSPRIGVGDRLWVRETWQALSFGDYQPTKSSQSEVRFAATDPCADLDQEARGYPWRPSIFMPRWASRITLTVTDVRVERLTSIGEEDARAEGIEPSHAMPSWWRSQTEGKSCPTAWDAYGDLWNAINGEGSWQADPWVIAYTFTVERSNIDQIGGAA